MSKRLALIAACSLAALSSVAVAQGWSSVNVNNTPTVVGNGQVVTQQRPVSDFRKIASHGSGDVIVQVGPRASLTVTADSNILPLLGTDVRKGELILRARHSYRTRHTPRYTITVPDLQALSIAGSGNGRVTGVSNRGFDLSIAGSGDVAASGQTGALGVNIAGSGDADLRALRASQVAVNIAGSGDVRVATNGPISGAIAGSGDIRYAGRPSSVQVSRIGSGRVSPLR